ncbi:mitochondrial 54S ribosomal protein bL17m LALA0_S13e01794g [Lachancea lanzarotensis]|uniref:LALA0S13e01794g1_1 n=1 Tax=Lachancea lanzarotensis TaxID=1245769 RepID=A0A0C7NEC3_9SACH|nr:uncharacterized protein LALA0_S13e01794g [Lachancea lanzarotensis]CEP64733.1 LALA0S13e01794g1_1 [Lachancea lanzarotensis]
MTRGLTRHFSRTKAHRDAMFRNLVTQLFQHGSIVSTHEKCQEAGRLAERIITMAKNLKKHPNSAKEIQSRLSLAGDSSKLLNRVVGELAPRYQTRPGGYTRVLKLEPRLGDRAKQSILELVDAPVVDQKGVFQRGNIKLWILCKTAIANETANVPYAPLTLQNFAKMFKFKSNRNEFFSRDVLAVRRFIKEDSKLPYDEATELQIIAQLQEQIKTLPEQASSNTTKTPGYTVVAERPSR